MKSIKYLMTHRLGQSLLERTLTKHCSPHGPKTKRLTFEFEPLSKAELDQLTRDLALYQALHPRAQSCGGWWSYANGRWALETCADQPHCCICRELLNRSQQEIVTAPTPSCSTTECEAGPSGESKSALEAVIKSKQDEVNTLTEQLSNKQCELDSLMTKLTALNQEEASTNLSPPHPTTPSWLLAKTVKQFTTLRTIVEDEESDFTADFSRPLPSYYPFSLVPREQGGQLFEPTESTTKVSPYVFQASCDMRSTSSASVCSSDSEETFCSPSSCVGITSSSSCLSISSDETLCAEVVLTKLPDLSIPAPSTPSYRLVKSVRNLKTITEDEECDFSAEFSGPLPTYSTLTLVPRKQREEMFQPKESTARVGPYAFQAHSTSSTNVCSAVSDETNSSCKSIIPMTAEVPTKLLDLPIPAPSTPSYCLVKSVRNLKTITEDEECDFSAEFSGPLPTYSTLTLVPRKQREEMFQPKESTARVGPYAFQAQSTSSTNVCSAVSDETNSSCKSIIPMTAEVPTKLLDLPIPAPSTPSYCLVKSVRSLKTITEDEECDFSAEFSGLLPTYSPLTLATCKQRGEMFQPKESNVRVGPYAFQAHSTSSASVCSAVSDETNSSCKSIIPMTAEVPTKLPDLSIPAPSTPSYCLVKSVRSSLKTITEDEECDFSTEFSAPLPTYSPLTLVPRKQREEMFQPKESTVSCCPCEFQQAPEYELNAIATTDEGASTEDSNTIATSNDQSPQSCITAQDNSLSTAPSTEQSTTLSDWEKLVEEVNTNEALIPWSNREYTDNKDCNDHEWFNKEFEIKSPGLPNRRTDHTMKPGCTAQSSTSQYVQDNRPQRSTFLCGQSNTSHHGQATSQHAPGSTSYGSTSNHAQSRISQLSASQCTQGRTTSPRTQGNTSQSTQSSYFHSRTFQRSTSRSQRGQRRPHNTVSRFSTSRGSAVDAVYHMEGPLSQSRVTGSQSQESRWSNDKPNRGTVRGRRRGLRGH